MIYRITGYLCDPEIYAFWPKKAILNVCEFNICVLQGVCGYPYRIYKLCELYLCDFSFTRIFA